MQKLVIGILVFMAAAVGVVAAVNGWRVERKALVELDVFSGRPNPAWQLSRERTQQLVDQLAKLPQTHGDDLPDQLGYRGFIVRLEQKGAGDQEIRLYGGVVRRTTGDATEYFADPELGLERWLLSTGRDVIEPDLYADLENELQQNGRRKPK